MSSSTHKIFFKFNVTYFKFILEKIEGVDPRLLIKLTIFNITLNELHCIRLFMKSNSFEEPKKFFFR